MDGHPLGLAWGTESEHCATCAWAYEGGPGPKVLRCRASGGERIEGQWRACSAWEREPDCLECAACCGPAYHAVEVGRRDPVRSLHPDVVILRDGRPQIARTPENYCVALGEGNRCRIYADRPRCCRDFEKQGANCLDARRRSGKSPVWGRP